MSKTNVIVVLDIGKTNLKICALALSDATQLAVLKRPNGVLQQAPYPQLDIEGIWHWYCENIKDLAQRFAISKLAFTTHGATAVCLSGNELALEVLDYESDLCCKADQQYNLQRPSYAQSLSPALGAGLNLGRQLHWQQQQFSDQFSTVDCILMYPQYWGWRMSGIKASEVTSLGCHTDLWNPQQQIFSSLVDNMGWRKLFPALLPTGQSLGPVLPALAKQLGLSPDCQVINGIHDSNASLVPYIKQAPSPCTVISTGTWVVIAAIGSPLTALLESQDMLANVSAFGESVPCIRFMGGREWQVLSTESPASLDDLNLIMQSGIQALPCFSEQGGPFSRLKGEFIGPTEQLNDNQRSALASLYCAFVTHYCLDLVQGKQPGNIYIEGSFARNSIYLNLLQQLNPQQKVLVSEDSTGTTLGTGLCVGDCEWQVKLPNTGVPVLQLETQPLEYYQIWLNLVLTHRDGSKSEDIRR
ncbi:MAG: hypothetical protein OFPI_39180 [Osedax symbiont Rs2]|nr:MAG: hypothetical protein OFPI_39180 [Osedax symbiont Rs2]